MLVQQLLVGLIGILAVAYGLTYLRNKRRTTEGFTPSPILTQPAIQGTAPPVPPEDDTRDLPWISTWSTADRAARAGDNCTPIYREAGPDGTFILTTPATCESGMAHTRPGDRIILPESIPIAAHEETVQHELIHIYQRRNPTLWLEFYRRQWSFIFFAEPPRDLPRAVREARRSNPDTWDPTSGGPWACWQGRYWPIPVYTNPAQPRLRDARVVWWDAQTHTVLREAPAPWRQFFGRPTQEEHPHELAAVMITAGDSSSEAGRRLLSWWTSTGRAQARATPS